MFHQAPFTMFDDIFNFQRETERLFNTLWNRLPAPGRTAAGPLSFQVNRTPEEWRVEVPIPGIDPKQVAISVVDRAVSIRAEEAGGPRDGEMRFEQTFSVPDFLDLDRLTAEYHHGMLGLRIPVKDSVKPRRIQIEGVEAAPKQLTTA